MRTAISAIFLSLLLTTASFAGQGLNAPVINVPTLKEAQKFAETLIKANKTDPLVVYHVGEEPPEQLKWIMVVLKGQNVPLTFKTVTESELQTILTEAKDRLMTDAYMLNADGALDGPDGKKIAEQRAASVHDTWQRASLMTRRVFGIPKGLTIWAHERTTKGQAIDAGLATVSSVVAGVSLAFSLYLNPGESIEPHIMRAVGTLAAWTWLTSFESAKIYDVMTFPKQVKEVKRNVFEARPSRLYYFGTSIFKSLLGNALITASAFGFEALVDGERFRQSLLNTSISLFARGWVDDWLGTKKPTINPDGTIVVDVTKGQWTLTKWVIVNSTFNILYSIPKTLHFLNKSHVADMIYYSMAAIGVMKIGYDERYEIRNKLRWIARKVRNFVAPDPCLALLTRKIVIMREPAAL